MSKYEVAKKRFQQDMHHYEELLETYYAQCEDEEKKAKAYIEERDRKNELTRNKYRAKIQEIESIINSIEEKKHTPVNYLAEIRTVRDEIIEAEEMLDYFYQAKKKLYHTGIIYKKYRNIVALSTFSEYLDSGRCTSLTGSAGAYNIYESEIRSNMIISQLSEVLSSLDQIANNQRKLHDEITLINYSLYELNDKMDCALNELRYIGASVDSIDNQTVILNQQMAQLVLNSEAVKQNTQIAAYYSERTAYYSDMNAELTNALGFLVALK